MIAFVLIAVSCVPVTGDLLREILALRNRATIPEGVVFGHYPSQDECLIVESLLGGGSAGIWLKQTIIDGTQAREGIDGSVGFAWY